MKTFFRLVSVTALALMLSTQVFAQEKKPTPEEKAYKFRTSLFQTFSWKFGQLIASKAKADQAAFSKHANDLASLSTLLEEGFQIENSLPEGTEAKPNIWEDYDTFKAKAESLTKAATELASDGAMDEFSPRDFGSKNCGGCHRDFRIKKEK